MLRSGYLIYFLFCISAFSPSCAKGHNRPVPAARFSFNDGNELDEISGKRARLSGVKFTEDRFGNSNHAVYLFGNEFSYINLGNYSALKPVAGSISLWIKIELEVHAGSGTVTNPILLTKCTDKDDFYEAYGIYYFPETKRIEACTMRDSIVQYGIYGMKTFERLTWHHLVVTYDDSFFAFYIDGKQEGRVRKNFRLSFNPLDSVMVGVSANKKNNRFTNGVVDDIEFYDEVLTPEQVTELYNASNPNRSSVILNWTLIILSFAAMIGLIYLFIRYRVSLTLKKEKQRLELSNTLLENELRINRALMNPHFVFNSLNTLHNYILSNNADKASDYLIKFSKLIRMILDSNLSDTISLELEIDLIQRYLEIESMRFKEHITHVLKIDPGIAPSSIHIPIMMIQPFVENSVWHGLRDKPGEKVIVISFSMHESRYLLCEIEDNGTGRKKRDPNLLEKKSLATGFVIQRLNLLNKIHGLNASLTITDKPANGGTIVRITLPILNK